jgi:hypothetical protein
MASGWGLGVRVNGLGLKVFETEFRMQGFWRKVWGMRFRVQGLRVWSAGYRV